MMCTKRIFLGSPTFTISHVACKNRSRGTEGPAQSWERTVGDPRFDEQNHGMDDAVDESAREHLNDGHDDEAHGGETLNDTI